MEEIRKILMVKNFDDQENLNMITESLKETRIAI